MYHRVIPRTEVKETVQAGMYVEPNTFARHIKFLKKFFLVVPIVELCSLRQRNFVNLSSSPLCVLTFDDGWCDFYKYAFPILKAHRVPATVFMPTDFIGTKDWFWTDRLALLLRYGDKLKKAEISPGATNNPIANKLFSLKVSREFRLESAIKLLKTYKNGEIEKVINELSAIWDIGPYPKGRAFLKWEEVREMALSGLITFGSHTASHRILTTLEEKDIESELTKSKDRLIAEKVVNPLCIPFSYPNGNYNGRIAEMVKEAGYGLAVTTKKGWNHHRSDYYVLKRMSIHQDMTSTDALLGCRIVGTF